MNGTDTEGESLTRRVEIERADQYLIDMTEEEVEEYTRRSKERVLLSESDAETWDVALDKAIEVVHDFGQHHDFYDGPWQAAKRMITVLELLKIEGKDEPGTVRPEDSGP